MKAENTVLDHSTERQVVKEGCEELPDVGISVLSKTFIIEPINLSDLFAFMVSSQNCYAFRVAHLKTDEKSDGLNRVVTAINIVSHEQIVVVRKLTSDRK